MRVVKMVVLFDMNGVLIDDEALHERAFRTALAELQLPLDHAGYQRHFAGKTDHDGFVAYLAARGVTASLDRLMTVKSDAYLLFAETQLHTYDDAVDLVHRLRRSGHPAGLVTGANRREVDLALTHLDLTFEVVVTAEDVTHGKPSPEPFLLAARLLGRPPRECVVIEDSPSGVAAARAAGMRCIAVTSTHSPAALHGAGEIVTSLADVPTSWLDHFVRA